LILEEKTFKIELNIQHPDNQKEIQSKTQCFFSDKKSLIIFLFSRDNVRNKRVFFSFLTQKQTKNHSIGEV
jgi:hypothetical protein